MDHGDGWLFLLAGGVSMSGLVNRMKGVFPNLFLFFTLFLRHVNNPPLATYVTQSKSRLFAFLAR